MKTYIHPTKNLTLAADVSTPHIPAMILAGILPQEIQAMLRPEYFDAHRFAQECEDMADCLRPEDYNMRKHARLMGAAEEFRYMAAKGGAE